MSTTEPEAAYTSAAVRSPCVSSGAVLPGDVVYCQTSTIADLNDIIVLVRVVETGSFSAAARKLGAPKSTVSRRIARLERALGARLLQRTTRKLGLMVGCYLF